MQLETTPTNIFISYAKADASTLDELSKYLRPLIRKENIHIWSDQDMAMGEDWNAAIEEKLQEADIVILLMSAYYFDSDFIYGTEMPIIKRRYDEGSIEVLPVIVRPCDWKWDPFILKLNDGKPINLWEDSNKGMAALAEAIRERSQNRHSSSVNLPIHQNVASNVVIPTVIPKIFISYAHADIEFHDEFIRHLAPLLRLKKLDVWSDRTILPGDEWDAAIKKNLNEADIIIYLISPDFYASDHVQEIEVRLGMARFKEGSATIIPLLIRPCPWEYDPFVSHLSKLTSNKISIAESPNKDEAWVNVVDDLMQVVEDPAAFEQQEKSLVGVLEQLRIENAQTKPLETFILYSKLDEPFFQAFKNSLSVLERGGQINVIDNHSIFPSKERAEETIKRHILGAEMLMILISADAIVDTYLEYEQEIRAFAEAQQVSGKQFIPVIIKNCLWADLPGLQDVQTLPTSGGPVSDWKFTDAAWVHVVQKIHDAIQYARNEKAKTPASFDLLARLTSPTPKAILAIESAGIHSLAQIEILDALERRLRDMSNNPDYRLCDTFDLVGGAGLGAAVAWQVALGLPVSLIRDNTQFTLNQYWTDFDRLRGQHVRHQYNHPDKTIKDLLTAVVHFEKHETTGELRFWSNHLDATQPPFDPSIEPDSFEFDILGTPDTRAQPGLTTDPGLFQNPELLLFHIATHPDYPFQWRVGEEHLLVVSIAAPNPLPLPSEDPVIASLAQAQQKHNRLAEWFFAGYPPSGPREHKGVPLGFPPARWLRIDQLALPNDHLPNTEFLRAQAERALESVDLSVIMPLATA